MVDKERIAELRLGVDRAEAALNEGRKVYDKANIEPREASLLQVLEVNLRIALGRLRKAEETILKEAARVEAEAEASRLRAPPDFQMLVEAFTVRDDSGEIVEAGYPRITPEAWDKFYRDMAEWKAKVRNGEFPPLTK